MAADHGLPVRLDHCFMRICLDVALGCRWDSVVARPAIHHLSAEQLGRAVAVAESCLTDPVCLAGYNRASLAMRGKAPTSQHPRNTGARFSTKARAASR